VRGNRLMPPRSLPLLPVWGVGRGREKRAGVMRVLGGGQRLGLKVSSARAGSIAPSSPTAYHPLQIVPLSALP
jgi:hypothetical protein